MIPTGGHKKLGRRELLISGVALGGATCSTGAAPITWRKSAVRPVVIASANGHRIKNGGTMTCVETAFSKMTSGTDVLESLIAGVNIVELDPEDNSVGYGGLPNADGVVQLDSCCMHGPRKRAGGVACLEGVRTPSLVAHAVMEQTDHHLLVGAGAQTFARNMGFAVEQDLNTDRSRRLWLEWKRKTDPLHYLNPKDRVEAGHRVTLAMARDGLIDPLHVYGTINCDGVNPRGEIAGVTTTSGLAFKTPGRVGDSPILGAGLYVDGVVGAAGSTGRGEANLFNLCSFLIVEELRQGRHPKDAGMAALKRIKSNTVEKRLLDERGNPNFDIQFYVLNAAGEHAGVSMRPRARYAICTEGGAELKDCDSLLGG